MLHRLTAMLAAWCLASIPAALLVGAFLRAAGAADRTAPEPPDPPTGASVPAEPSSPPPAPAGYVWKRVAA